MDYKPIALISFNRWQSFQRALPETNLGIPHQGLVKDIYTAMTEMSGGVFTCLLARPNAEDEKISRFRAAFWYRMQLPVLEKILEALTVHQEEELVLWLFGLYTLMDLRYLPLEEYAVIAHLINKALIPRSGLSPSVPLIFRLSPSQILSVRKLLPSSQGVGHMEGIRNAFFKRSVEPLAMYEDWLNTMSAASEAMQEVLRTYFLPQAPKKLTQDKEQARETIRQFLEELLTGGEGSEVEGKSSSPVRKWDEFVKGHPRFGAYERLFGKEGLLPEGVEHVLMPFGVEDREQLLFLSRGHHPKELMLKIGREYGLPLLETECSEDEYARWEAYGEIPQDIAEEVERLYMGTV